MPAGGFVRRVLQVRLQRRVIVEFEKCDVLIVHLHRLLVAGQAMPDAATDPQRTDRGNVCCRVLKISEDSLPLVFTEIRARLEEDDVDDQR